MTAATTSPDRRQRRRQESIDEILDIAVEIMGESGVAGLSLGEVARRVGIRTPSLYGYFSSKNAVYDALFARGAQSVLDAVLAVEAEVDEAPDLTAALLVLSTAMVRWGVENPVYSQLLFWRPVPGFEPSPESYAPAVAMVDRGRATLAALQAQGWLRADVAVDDALRDWTILIAGVVSQQLSNAPDESFEGGRFTGALPSVNSMFAQHYAPQSTARPHPAPSTRRTRNAHRR